MGWSTKWVGRPKWDRPIAIDEMWSDETWVDQIVPHVLLYTIVLAMVDPIRPIRCKVVASLIKLKPVPPRDNFRVSVYVETQWDFFVPWKQFLCQLLSFRQRMNHWYEAVVGQAASLDLPTFSVGWDIDNFVIFGESGWAIIEFHFSVKSVNLSLGFMVIRQVYQVRCRSVSRAAVWACYACHPGRIFVDQIEDVSHGTHTRVFKVESLASILISASDGTLWFIHCFGRVFSLANFQAKYWSDEGHQQKVKLSPHVVALKMVNEPPAVL